MSAPSGAALACVPGLAPGQSPLRLERLLGGSVNEVFRVDSPAGRFVLRIDGAAWRRPGVERARELALHRAAAAGGLAPAIVYPPADPAADHHREVLVTDFLDGRLWQAADFDDVRALQRLGERLYALHRLAVPELAAFDPWQVAQAYVAAIAPRQCAALEQVLRRLEPICAEIAGAALAPAIVHGDLWQSNLLQGADLWLLDWEYAQRSDALMDVACALAYYPIAQRHARELLAAAGLSGRSPQALSERVFVYRALSWLWHLARGEVLEAP